MGATENKNSEEDFSVLTIKEKGKSWVPTGNFR